MRRDHPATIFSLFNAKLDHVQIFGNRTNGQRSRFCWVVEFWIKLLSVLSVFFDLPCSVGQLHHSSDQHTAKRNGTKNRGGAIHVVGIWFTSSR